MGSILSHIALLEFSEASSLWTPLTYSKFVKVVGGLIAYTLSFAALGEWKGWWDKYKTVPGSPKDIANRELMAIEKAKRKKILEDVFATSVRPDAIEAISDEGQVQRIKHSEGVIESAERKVTL